LCCKAFLLWHREEQTRVILPLFRALARLFHALFSRFSPLSVPSAFWLSALLRHDWQKRVGIGSALPMPFATPTAFVALSSASKTACPVLRLLVTLAVPLGLCFGVLLTPEQQLLIKVKRQEPDESGSR
jgi:hypothetical protein